MNSSSNHRLTAIMKKCSNLLLLLLITSGFLLLTGCCPGSSIVLSNDASLKELNELVKERSVRVTTDSVYTDDNIIITRDTTVVENYSTIQNLIPLSGIKSITYTSNNKPPDGYIILKNDQSIKAQNIYTLMNDSVKYDQDITTSVIFPTKELVKIQKRNHFASTLNGAGYGLMSGIAVGALIGSIGFAAVGDPLFLVVTLGAVGISGTILGTVIGAGIGQWEDINITYRFENISP
jgi:hypothetical protein